MQFIMFPIPALVTTEAQRWSLPLPESLSEDKVAKFPPLLPDNVRCKASRELRIGGHLVPQDNLTYPDTYSKLSTYIL